MPLVFEETTSDAASLVPEQRVVLLFCRGRARCLFAASRELVHKLFEHCGWEARLYPLSF